MARRTLTAALAAGVIWVAAGQCTAQAGGAATKPATPPAAAPKSPAPTPPAAPALVLDTYGNWRNFHVMSPPVIQFDDGPKPVLTPIDWLNRPTAPAPADWRKNEFDDATWQKGSARAFARTPYLERLCLRARFEVTDPAAVKGLKLTLAYYGGAIVTINGQELVRGHVAKEGPASLAEGYPPEAFLTDDGKITPAAEWVMARYKKQLALRERSLTDVAIPAKTLRKGVNVLAVEIVRAPYHKVVDEKKIDPNKSRDTAGQGCPYDLSWSLCELRSVKLAAAGEEGLVPNAARPKEMQVWNGDFVTPDYESDLGDRCEPIRPVTILAPRGGWGHGKVVVGSPRTIAGLKATCGDLKGEGGVIAASAARIRYGWSWGSGSIEGYGDAVRSGATLLDALIDVLPEANRPGQFGTVAPIWVTFQVPAGARAGVYKGELTITARDEKPTNVPVYLEVADWSAPDAKDYRAWIELIQSPDTLALEYGAPMWSPKHLELIGQSLRYIGQIGSRVAYVPLICFTNFGNEESMVRWVKKDGGGYEYDFTAMDRYLDQVEKNMGTPKFTVFQTWEIYLATPKEASPVQVKGGEGSWEWTESSAVKARQEWKGKGPAVTVLDRATGKTEVMILPRFDDPAAVAMWKPLFTAIRERVQKRGWEKTMALGMAADIYPTKEEVVTLEAISGNLPWVRHTHGGNSVGQKMQGIGQIDYTAYVWNVEFAPDPSKGHLYGWKQPDLFTQFRRFTAINYFAPASALHFEELNITGKQRGLGRIGADFWPVLKDKQGRRRSSVGDRYIQSYWHSLNLSSHLLVPGPAGPVASTRYEQFREGLQECEARIAIETVLTDETLKAKIGPDLAKRCQDALDERLRTLWRAGSPMQLNGRDYASAKLVGDTYGGAAGQFWFAGAGWQERTRQLYALAGEVARSVAQKQAQPAN